MKLKRNYTPLKNMSYKNLRRLAFDDFGVIVTHEQAKEIRDSIRHGVATWSNGRYVSTCPTDEIYRMDAKGVRSLGNSFYTRKEWNTEHKDHNIYD